MDEGLECQPLRLAGGWCRRPQVRAELAPALRPYPSGELEPAFARCCRTLNRRYKKMHGFRGGRGRRRDALHVNHGDQPAIPTARFIVVKDEAIERGQRAVTANCSERVSEREENHLFYSSLFFSPTLSSSFSSSLKHSFYGGGPGMRIPTPSLRRHSPHFSYSARREKARNTLFRQQPRSYFLPL